MVKPFYSLEELHRWTAEVELGLAFLEVHHLYFLEMGAGAYWEWMKAQLRAQQIQCHGLIREHYSPKAA